MRLRLRFGYLKRYGWFKRFGFGFLLGPVLFYKSKQMLFVKKHIDRDALVDVGVNLTTMVYDEATKELFQSIPYDFIFRSVETLTYYDIDYNRYCLVTQGMPTKEK